MTRACDTCRDEIEPGCMVKVARSKLDAAPEETADPELHFCSIPCMTRWGTSAVIGNDWAARRDEVFARGASEIDAAV